MATFRGTIRKNDLEGGFWELHGDDGKHYQLRGGGADLRVEGLTVIVNGTIDRNAMTIGMTGPLIDVASWQKIA